MEPRTIRLGRLAAACVARCDGPHGIPPSLTNGHRQRADRTRVATAPAVPHAADLPRLPVSTRSSSLNGSATRRDPRDGPDARGPGRQRRPDDLPRSWTSPRRSGVLAPFRCSSSPFLGRRASPSGRARSSRSRWRVHANAYAIAMGTTRPTCTWVVGKMFEPASRVPAGALGGRPLHGDRRLDGSDRRKPRLLRGSSPSGLILLRARLQAQLAWLRFVQQQVASASYARSGQHGSSGGSIVTIGRLGPGERRRSSAACTTSARSRARSLQDRHGRSQGEGRRSSGRSRSKGKEQPCRLREPRLRRRGLDANNTPSTNRAWVLLA